MSAEKLDSSSRCRLRLDLRHVLQTASLVGKTECDSRDWLPPFGHSPSFPPRPMALRIHDSVVHGEIDNRVKGIVRGRLWLKGRLEPVTLELKGNAHPD